MKRLTASPRGLRVGGSGTHGVAATAGHGTLGVLPRAQPAAGSGKRRLPLDLLLRCLICLTAATHTREYTLKRMRLGEVTFGTLCKLVRVGLEECNAARDFSSARALMHMASTFYFAPAPATASASPLASSQRSVRLYFPPAARPANLPNCSWSGSKKDVLYLRQRVEDAPIWKNNSFWKYMFTGTYSPGCSPPLLSLRIGGLTTNPPNRYLRAGVQGKSEGAEGLGAG